MLNRKILTSLLVIAVVAVMVGMGTFAYFSDSETSTGNTFTAGTLDLQVNGRDDSNVGTLVTIEAKPSQRKVVGPIKVHNKGTNSGVLDLHFNNVVDLENGIVEPEQDYYTANNITERNDISNALFVDLMVDYDGDDVIDETLIPDFVVTLGALKSRTLDFPKPIPPSNTWYIYLSFHLCSNVGNWGQSDKTTFDIEFTLHQVNAPHDTHTRLPLGGRATDPQPPTVPGDDMTIVAPTGQLSQFDQWIEAQRAYVESFFDVFFADTTDGG